MFLFMIFGATVVGLWLVGLAINRQQDEQFWNNLHSWEGHALDRLLQAQYLRK